MKRTLKHLQTAGVVFLVTASLMIVSPSDAEPEALDIDALIALAAADGAPSGTPIDMAGYLWDDGYMAQGNEVLYLNMLATLAYLWGDTSGAEGEPGGPIPDPNGYLWSDVPFEFIEDLW